MIPLGQADYGQRGILLRLSDRLFDFVPGNAYNIAKYYNVTLCQAGGVWALQTKIYYSSSRILSIDLILGRAGESGFEIFNFVTNVIDDQTNCP